MGETDLAGRRWTAAANHTRVADRAVRGPEGADRQQRFSSESPAGPWRCRYGAVVSRLSLGVNGGRIVDRR